MRCTRIKKNKCGYRIDKELTNHSIRLIINLLHVNMVHMPLVERIGLDDSIPIGLRAVCGIVSHVLAPETLDVTQVLWCLVILTVVSIASIGSIASPIPIVPSIAISIAILVTIAVVVAIMVVTIPTMMVMSSTVDMAIPTIVVMSMVMSS